MHLFNLVNIFCGHVQIRETTVGKRSAGQAYVFKRLRDGSSITVKRYNKITQWFSDHWPLDLDWPYDIPRPAPATDSPVAKAVAEARDTSPLSSLNADGIIANPNAFCKALFAQRNIYDQAVFTQRRLAVVSRESKVIPGGERRRDKMAADFIREMLEHIRWDTVTDRMLYGRFYGYAVAEALWARDGQQVVLDALKVRNRRRFVFDADFNLKLVTTSHPNGEELPANKFWVLATGADNDDEPYGLGLAHWLYWLVYFKRSQTKFWLIAQEKFGQPTIVGKYPSTADAAQKNALQEAIRAVKVDGGITMRDDMIIELLEAGHSGRMAYADFYDRMNSAIAKVVLGQTMTTDDGSSQSQANVHMAVRQDIVEADERLINESFSRSIIRWLIDWNFPDSAYPKVTRDLNDAPDLKALAERDKVIFDMGYQPTKQYVEDTYNIEIEERDAPSQDEQPPTTTDATSFAEPTDNEAKQHTRDLLGPQTDAWLETIKRQLFNVESTNEFRDWLDNFSISEINTGAFEDDLGKALIVAHLSGRSDVEDNMQSDTIDFAEGDNARVFFNEQITFFRNKLSLPTRTWTDIWQSQHDVAFVVAGAARDGLLTDLRGAVDSAISEGTTLEKFRQRFDGIVAKHGWSYKGGRDWRTRVIYDTNLRTSYAAGRWQQLQAVKNRRPYWQYRHSPASQEPREGHLAWDGLVLSADDPWWRTHYPPNGWGCKCSVDALAERDLKKLGKDKPDKAS